MLHPIGYFFYRLWWLLLAITFPLSLVLVLITCVVMSHFEDDVW